MFCFMYWEHTAIIAVGPVVLQSCMDLWESVPVLWSEICRTSSHNVDQCINFKTEDVWHIFSIFRVKEELKHETSKKHMTGKERALCLPSAFYFLVRLAHCPWQQRQYIPPKCLSVQVTHLDGVRCSCCVFSNPWPSQFCPSVALIFISVVGAAGG